MIRKIFLIFACAAAIVTAAAFPAQADCKDEIQEVREDIDRNKDNYTMEAIAKARKHLLQAEIPSLKLADCRREVAAARQALRPGRK
jgi:hypothetical protein